MPHIAKAVAIANNEVAYLAWELDSTSIPGCLGFHIVREYLDANDQVTAERPLASYVAFDARYSPHYKITDEELEWLIERVGVLQTFVRQVCEERPEAQAK